MFRARYLSSLAVMAVVASGTALAASSSTDEITFQLFPNPAVLACLTADDGKTPTATVHVHRGLRNDHLRVTLKHVKSGLHLNLFTVERSNQDADGNAVAGFTNFGLAWYQSEAATSRHPTKVDINTILLDQIFGFDPDVGLTPKQTLHVGLWFDDPAAAAGCGFSGSTPFNDVHAAGPVAFISRPDATTGLGPLCTNPNTSTIPATCNP
jgi:hypothetical protein